MKRYEQRSRGISRALGTEGEERRDQLDQVAADTLGDGRPPPDACVSAREELRLIEAAIEELPPKCRKVFIMLRVEERSFKEIALAMALSETMVRKYAMRALEHCRARLAEQKEARPGAKPPGEIVESTNQSGGKR